MHVMRGRYVSQFGFTPDTLPTVFVFDYPNERYFAREELIVATKREMQEFLEDVLNGRAPVRDALLWSCAVACICLPNTCCAVLVCSRRARLRGTIPRSCGEYVRRCLQG